MQTADVIIIGAGAAGLMCAIEAGKRGQRVLVLDHANKAGKKILMSGGGRCNFTNLAISPANYLSHNPHFCKSALSRYTQWDFIALVNKHRIQFHEKTHGQLFCNDKASAIVTMLLTECAHANVNVQLHTKIEQVATCGARAFKIKTSSGIWQSGALVIASGGLSIPTMGASPFAYHIAQQFGIKVWPTRAGLVPLTLQPEIKEQLSTLAGVAVASQVQCETQTFRENILFTHRGLSGPAILQISSYWHSGTALTINLLPELNLAVELVELKRTQPRKTLKNSLSDYLPKRVVELFVPATACEKSLQELTLQELQQIARQLNAWTLKPNGTEGYRTAEVTLGGIDCDAVSSKTFETAQVPGLYFIGEALDVTGWLGGYNFQWAWASGWAAGQVV